VLESVTVQFDASVFGDFEMWTTGVTNPPSTFQVILDATVSTWSTLPDGITPDGLISFTLNPSHTYGPYTVPANGEHLLEYLDYVAVTGSLTFTGGDLAAFQGPGNLLFNASAVGNSTWTGSGNVVMDLVTGALGIISVTYNVPEPATILLLGLGLVGLASFARRKRINMR
jgi:hypothetical protein